jgi:hypothetical protein
MMSDELPAPRKTDDHALLLRRAELTDVHGVAFTLYRPDIPDGEPSYPLRWVADWTDAHGPHASEPMPMTALVPAVEKALGLGEPS